MRSERHNFNGIEHHVSLWGEPDAPPLFFIHGWMDSGVSWQRVCEPLAKDYRCIAPDLRGFGQSGHTTHPLGYFFHEYLADLDALFAHYAADQAVQVVGHSMGGNVLTLYAGTVPERVSTLINVEGFGNRGDPPAAAPARARRWLDKQSFTFKTFDTIDGIVSRLMATNPALDEKLADAIAGHLSRRTADGKFTYAADPQHKRANAYLIPLEQYFAFWEAITARCLIVIGEKSELGSWLEHDSDYEAELRRRLEHFPDGTESVVIADSGHMPHHDQPARLVAVIADFLSCSDLATETETD